MPKVSKQNATDCRAKGVADRAEEALSYSVTSSSFERTSMELGYAD